jgi:hypothetical protein
MNYAIKQFIEENGKEILEQNLYRNFVLHVCNLFEFGVLGAGHVFTAITRIQKFITDNSTGVKFNNDWSEQRNHWSKLMSTQKEMSSSDASSSKKARKDFSGIFKQSEKINPFVVLTAINCNSSSVILNNSETRDDKAEQLIEPSAKEEVVDEAVAKVEQPSVDPVAKTQQDTVETVSSVAKEDIINQ